MRIGELAARAGVNIQTLRFYEREALMPAPVRTASGYRSYQERDLERVRFIRLCQGLGFTLREVQQLLHLHMKFSKYKGKTVMKPAAVREIVAMGEERLAVIDDKIKTLNSIRGDLATLLKALTGESPAACPVRHK